MPDPYWNRNTAYHRVVLAAVPEGCRTALDVGCGDGLLARKLAARAGHVTGVDRSARMVHRAREGARGLENVTFRTADYLDPDGPAGGAYAFVSAVAVVHHAPFEEAVAALVGLTRPGGRLVIVGLARNGTPLDWLISGWGLPASRLLAALHGGRRGPAGMPVRDAALAWGEVRRAARRLLPGCRVRRRLLWRYTVVWDRPAAGRGAR